MKRMRMVIALAVMMAAVGWGRAAAQGSTAAVSIKDFQYDPASLTVKVGTTVTWTNTGAAEHTVTAADGSWDSGTLAPGATWSRTFDSAATVAYYCIFHGSATGTGMAGSLVVATEQPTAAPAPPTAVPSGPTPSISASDQPISNNMITVAKVVAAQDGWIAVHKTGPDGKLLVTPIVGKVAIKAGTTENVKVELTEAFKAGDVLYPMLHIDAGTMGTYEFPGPDSPVQVDGNVIVAKLTVTAAPAVPPSLPNTGRPADASLWIAALALALLLGGMLVLRRRRAA